MTDMKRILLVEDEERLAEMYASVLRETYTVRTALDGERALDAIDGVDAVLLDRRLPGLSGHEVLERIRAAGVDAPVAMLTAVEPDWDVIGMQFDDYLLKPVDSETLERAVERLLALGRLDPEIRDHVRRSVTQAAIEGQKDDAELAESESFEQLRATVAEAAVELGDVTTGLDPRETELIVESITRNLDAGDADSATDTGW